MTNDADRARYVLRLGSTFYSGEISLMTPAGLVSVLYRSKSLINTFTAEFEFLAPSSNASLLAL